MISKMVVAAFLSHWCSQVYGRITPIERALSAVVIVYAELPKSESHITTEVLQEAQKSILSQNDALSTHASSIAHTLSVIGTGFFIHQDGIIVTSYHVVAEAAALSAPIYVRTYKAQISDYTQTYDAKDIPHAAQIIGVDEEKDIAVLKIESRAPHALQWSLRDAQIAEPVFAIGHAYDFLKFLVTGGIVSHPSQSVDVSILDENKTEGSKQTFLITTASIYQGFSGGPIINSEGKVLAVTYSSLMSTPIIQGVASDTQENTTSSMVNISFGIKSQIARETVERILSNPKQYAIKLNEKNTKEPLQQNTTSSNKKIPSSLESPSSGPISLIEDIDFEEGLTL